MKRIFNFLKKHPIYCLIIIICLVFLPSAIVAEPDSQSKLIVRALGIDKTGEEFEVSAIVFTPKANQMFSENYKVVEGKGNSLYEAVTAVAIATGKKIGLAHTGVVFVNDGACVDGLVKTMDYLIRDYNLGNDTFVMYVPDSAKNMVKAAHSLAQDSGIKIGDIAHFDQDNIVLQKSNIESIYDSSYSPSKCVLLNVIELDENDGLETSGSQTSGSGGGGGSGESEGGGSGGGGEQQKKILNGGKALVIKEGRKALMLEAEDVNKFKWTKNFTDALVFTLENYNDANFTNANITFSVSKNSVKYKVNFNGEKPICKIKINPTMSLTEVNQDSLDSDIYISPSRLETKELKEAVNTKIVEQVKEIMNLFISKNLDVNLIYELFNASSPKKFQKFLNSLENENDYMSKIDFEIECNSTITN